MKILSEQYREKQKRNFVKYNESDVETDIHLVILLMLVVDTLNNIDFSEVFAFVDNVTTNFVDKLELDNLGNIIFPLQEG